MKLSLLLFISLPIFAANYASEIAVKLDAGKKSFTLTNSGTQGGTLLVSVGLPAGWAQAGVVISNIFAPPTSATTYTACADPCGTGGTASLMTMNRQWGQQYYWVVRLDGSGSPVSPFARSEASGAYVSNRCDGIGTLPQVLVPVVTTSPMPMPIKVIGQDCYIAPSRQFSLVSGHASTGLRGYVRISSPWYTNNVRADGKISVRINGGSWIALTDANLTAIDEMRYYGGAGSFPRVREFTFSISNGTVGPSDTTATVEFRFNGTEGNTSGARILMFNILESADQTISTMDVASNVATAHVTTHGYSSSDTVLIQNTPGMYSRFNGIRTLTGVATNTFTFVPCGTSLTASFGCTSPNATGVTPPICRADSCTGPLTQITMKVARALIAQSSYTAATPDSAAPGGGDVTRGGCLFKFGNTSCATGQHDQLVNPNQSYLNFTLHNGFCGSCHANGGIDLAIFNYDNYEIERRSEFHGLSEQDGLDIATYIRGLGVGTTYGRPWNPPMQPTPGLAAASTDTNAFFAGGGIDSVLLTGFNDHLEYLAPGGDTSGWDPDKRLEPRDLPLPYQLPDWNQWLPIVFPGDAFQSPVADFLSSTCYTVYKSILDNLTVNNFSSYAANGYGSFYSGCGDFLGAVGYIGDGYAAGNVAPSQFPTMKFAIQQWAMTKTFEIAVEKRSFQFYGQYIQAVHGGSATPNPLWPIAQGVLDNVIFNVGMHRLTMYNGLYNINFATGVGLCTYAYQSNIWYMAQVIINAGNGWDTPQNPIDNAYYNAFLKGINYDCRPNGFVGYIHPALFTSQSGNVNPDLNRHNGSPGLDWSPFWSLSFPYTNRYSYWMMPHSDFVTYVADPLLRMMNVLLASHTADYWSNTLTNDAGGCCNAALTESLSSGSPGPATAYLLPLYKVWGTNSTQQTNFKTWADGQTTGGRYFTGHNFTTDLNTATEGDSAGTITGSLATPQPITGNTLTLGTCPVGPSSPVSFLVSSTGGEPQEVLVGFGPATCTAGNPGTMTFYNTLPHTGTPIVTWGCSTSVNPGPNKVPDGPPRWWQCSNMY